jgi:steroid 5-alpha reductase family enzyme
LRHEADERYFLSAVKFGAVWAGQALWVWLTLLPVLILNGSRNNTGFRWSDIVGGFIWVCGFICELTADLQKSAFKNKPENKGRFINTGRASRHATAQPFPSDRLPVPP